MFVPLGLLLTNKEFHAFIDECVMRGQVKIALNLRQRLLTSGHFGALADLLKWISTSTVCVQVSAHLIFSTSGALGGKRGHSE
jgi:hypothetical protein